MQILNNYNLTGYVAKLNKLQVSMQHDGRITLKDVTLKEGKDYTRAGTYGKFICKCQDEILDVSRSMES